MKYKVIIFDFFGVISAEIANTWLGEYFSKDALLEFRKNYIEPTDRGDIDEDQFFNILSNAASIAPEKIRQEWLNRAQLNQGTLGLIKKLTDQYKLVILSDSPLAIFSRNHYEK